MGIRHQTFGARERAAIIEAIERGAEQGKSVGTTAREFGITASTFYRWIRERSLADSGHGKPEQALDAAYLAEHRGLGDVGVSVPRRGMAAEPRYSEPRTRTQWNPAAKEAIVAKARPLRDRGASWRDIGMRLGTNPENIRRWCARDAGGSSPLLPAVVEPVPEPEVAAQMRGSVSRDQGRGFVQVAVVQEGPIVEGCRPTVVSPSGYRVEGLDLAGVVTVLKALS